MIIRWLFFLALGVLAVLTVAQAIWFSLSRTEIVECQARYNRTVVEAVERQQRRIQNYRANTQDAIRAIATADTEREQARALREFAAAQQELESRATRIPRLSEKCDA